MTAIERFHADGAQQWLVEYSLTPKSIVFDVGGYFGGWTAELLKSAYVNDPCVLVFEPIAEYFEACVERFREHHNVKVFNFGLSNQNADIALFKNGSASALVEIIPISEPLVIEHCKFVDVDTFMRDMEIPEIDLISMNIEGGEYRLLDRIINTDLIKRCRNVQVQFHGEHDGLLRAFRATLQGKLETTHALIWDYPWVWESWRRRDAVVPRARIPEWTPLAK